MPTAEVFLETVTVWIRKRHSWGGSSDNDSEHLSQDAIRIKGAGAERKEKYVPLAESADPWPSEFGSHRWLPVPQKEDSQLYPSSLPMFLVFFPGAVMFD